MLTLLNRRARQQQTLASFDYQWGTLPEGDLMLSDSWFRANACLVVEELTGISASWFAGKRVLDAGCGGGRWSYALCLLGAEVTAVDFSEAALERTRTACAEFGQIETIRANLLDPPRALLDRQFDFVFSFGVLHHTGDTFAALGNIAELVSSTGLIFLYLYGASSWTLRQRFGIEWTRLRLAGLSFDEKVAHLRRRYPERDPHQAFDLLSPTINDRLTVPEVTAELERLGFRGVTQTVVSREVCVRAQRPGFEALDALRPGLVPESESLLWSHAHELERLRRDKVFERRYWELGLSRGNSPIRERGADLCARFKIEFETLRGKRILVADPDSAKLASELRECGADVDCLAPTFMWGESVGLGLRVVEGSVLDEGDGECPYDAVFAAGAAVSLSRNPIAAVQRLASRLVRGGILVVDTLAPEATTAAHRRRRLLLKPWRLEGKIRRLLQANPHVGLAGAFALLSPGLPPRMSESELLQAMTEAGCTDVVTLLYGSRILAKGLVG